MIIGATSEFRRVQGIPRRVWTEDSDLYGLRDFLTERYKTPDGGMSLHPCQAVALAELELYGGLFAPLAVGSGKTLISFLASRAVNALRPLLLIPAKLRPKTEKAGEEATDHWVFTPPKILTYELLARDRGLHELAAYSPDLIVADEAHRLKNRSAACSRRIRRYLNEHPDVSYVDLSGTTVKRSLDDYAVRLSWALPPAHYPLPAGYNERMDWARALDPKVPAGERNEPGALKELCEEGETLAEGFGRRLTETPGVVSNPPSAGGCAASIRIEGFDFGICDKAISALKTLRDLWELPDGEQFSEAVDLWRHARSIACGFWYKWDPTPPAEWLDARRAWHRFVRETIAGSNKYDTQLQVANALDRGKLHSSTFDTWMRVMPIFKPTRTVTWNCDCMLEAVADWAKASDGIVWVEHVAFGEALAMKTDLPYFREQGRDKDGQMIEDYRGSSIIASIAACGEGFNLQHYNRNLVVAPPASGTKWEQLIGRTHRYGQEADEVTIEVALKLYEQKAALKQSMDDAEYIAKTTKQTQKLLLADKAFT